MRRQLRDIAWQNKRVVYDFLMKAAADTTLAIAANPRRLGIRLRGYGDRVDWTPEPAPETGNRMHCHRNLGATRAERKPNTITRFILLTSTTL